jgi:hypothetical protein
MKYAIQEYTKEGKLEGCYLERIPANGEWSVTGGLLYATKFDTETEAQAVIDKIQPDWSRKLAVVGLHGQW